MLLNDVRSQDETRPWVSLCDDDFSAFKRLKDLKSFPDPALIFNRNVKQVRFIGGQVEP